MSRVIISANKAAKLLDVEPRTVRARLRNGVWTFGRAIPPTGDKKQWTYEVYLKQLKDYLEGR